MVLDHGLCGFEAETNSLKDLLAFLSLDDFGGNCPNHRMVVWGLVWLQPVLVFWARSYWVGLLPLVWLVVLVLAAIGDTVTGGDRHGDVWPLPMGLDGPSPSVQRCGGLFCTIETTRLCAQ